MDSTTSTPAETEAHSVAPKDAPAVAHVTPKTLNVVRAVDNDSKLAQVTPRVAQTSPAVTQLAQEVAQPSQAMAQPYQQLVQPSQAVTHPYQPLAQPSQAVTQPSQAVTHPYQAVTHPYQAVTHPYQPLAQPSQAMTRSYQPLAQPSYAVTQPYQSLAQPSQAVTQPYQPLAQPSYAVTPPYQPLAQPSYAVTQPSYAVTQPYQPLAQLSQAVTQPYQSLAQPSQAVNQPFQSQAQTSQAVTHPYPKLAQSSQAVTQPYQPQAQPSQAVNQPYQSQAQSSQAVTQPYQPLVQPLYAVTQPYQPLAQPSQTTTQPSQAVTPPAPAVTQSVARNRVRGGRRRRMPPNAATVPEPHPYRVHVSGFPPYTQQSELLQAFEEIGPAFPEWLTDCSVCLLFTCKEHTEAAIAHNNKIIIYGHFLSIRPYTPRQVPSPKHTYKRVFVKSKEKDVIIPPTSLDLSGDFCAQLDALLAAVRLTMEEAAALGALYADLEEALTPHMPGCVAMPFGSITTGLGIKTSDADCFVMVPGNNDASQMVNKAKRILQMHPEKFTEILPIPRANTPIVKFFHVPTGTNCDLSFKTPLGAQNSRLIAFLLQADPRLIPVAVAIKYWAKVHDLSGTGKMTNYALTMLIIFYLQQITMLPAICTLQQQRKYDCIVDSWNTGFNDTPLPPSANTASISELIGGFFLYYSQFNFDINVVCPFLGTPIKKEMFIDPNKLPSEFDRYKHNVFSETALPVRINTTICVQDPFEQSHNVASSINQRKAEDIKAFFKFSAEAYEKEKQDECKNFLKTILLQKPKCVKAKLHPEYRVTLTWKILSQIVSPDWKAVVREIVFVIFESLLKLKLTKVTDKEKTIKVPNKHKEKYTAIVTKAIWKRKQLTKLYSLMKLDFKRREARITEELMTIEKGVFNLPFTLNLSYTTKQAALLIRLQDGDVEIFKEFGKFFTMIMQKWFISLLQPYTKNPHRQMPINISESGGDNCNDVTIDTNIFENVASGTGNTSVNGCCSNDSVLMNQGEECENSEATKKDEVTKSVDVKKDTATDNNMDIIDDVVTKKDVAVEKSVVTDKNRLEVMENDIRTEKDLAMIEKSVMEIDIVTEKGLTKNKNLVIENDVVAEKDLVMIENEVTENDVSEENVATEKEVVVN